MKIYPRKYSVEQGELAPVLQFHWDVPGFSIWGIMVVSFYLIFKLKAKVIHKMQSTVESQWVAEFEGNEISIYQDDMFGLTVSLMQGSDPSCMSKLVNLFSKSFLFSESKSIKTR